MVTETDGEAAVSRAQGRATSGAPLWSARFARLLQHGLLNLRPSRLKFVQPLSQVGHFLLDLSELGLVLVPPQMTYTKLLSDVPLKLTPQDSDIWIAPYCTLAVLKFAGSYALHNEVPAHPVFLRGRYVADGGPFAIPFTVFRHMSLSQAESG